MGQAPLRMGTTEHARAPKKGARPVIRINGGTRPVPLLTGTVGRPPSMNAAADVKLVQDAFEAIATLRPAAPTALPAPTPGVPAAMLALAEAVRNYKADLVGAIERFQTIEDIREDAGQRGIIAPDSLSWETLFTYGEVARDLNTVRDRKVSPIDYIHSGGFDTAKFEAAAATAFASGKQDGGRWRPGSSAAVIDLLGRCARDPRIVDIRWIAYILATVMWETTHQVTVANTKGKGTHREPRWADPVEEGGKGYLNAKDVKDYYLPVKVTATATGATVVEQDGESFDVGMTGQITRRSSRTATHGARYGGAVSPDYVKATGTELKYYGRGYVQLTWWDNYASTGAEVGLGLELLLRPERALEPDIAFEVMVHGLMYGTGFANRMSLKMYLSGAKTDYVGARAMVNGTNENQKIAAVARVFEAALLAARR